MKKSIPLFIMCFITFLGFAQEKNINKNDYEKYDSLKLTLLGKKNIGKKIVLEVSYVEFISDIGINIIEGLEPAGMINYCTFDDHLINEIMEAKKLANQYSKQAFKNFYGFIEVNYGSPVIHIQYIEDLYK